MSRVVAIVVLLLIILTAAGIILTGIYQARTEEEMRRCQDHLRQIGSFGLLHAALPGQPVPVKAQESFPSGTVMNAKLPPEKRLSWYPLILSAVDQGPLKPGEKPTKSPHFTELIQSFDTVIAWDEGNNPQAARTRLNFALCPAQRPQWGDGPALTNYLGIGGIGKDTAALPLEEAGRQAGVFRYDTPTPLALIRDGDGLENAISVGESAHNLGPWMQGGPATIRSLDPNEMPYQGPGRPFAGCHRDRGNFAFADGSVRVLTDRMEPALFAALLTIQGRETEADFNKQ